MSDFPQTDADGSTDVDVVTEQAVEPDAVAPVTDVPAADEPEAEAPVADEPEAEAPVADEPEAEAPAAPADDLDDLLGLAGADAGADTEAPEPAVESVPDPVADASDDTTDAPEDGADEAVVELQVAAPRPRPRVIEDVRDQKELARLFGDWFVVHTYAGYEQRVKDNLAHRIEALDAHDRVYEVVIPTEEVTEFKKGKKQVSQKKFLPGYVLVRMDMDDETWNIVRHTPAVTGFVGATGSKPVPLSLTEVGEMLKLPVELIEETEEEMAEHAEAAKSAVVEIDLDVGETIRVTTGPFADFTGTIAEINLDQAKLKVLVSVFGRETPLELPFDNVAKL